MGLENVLIIPDTHRGHHHVKAYNLMIEAASFIGVEHIYLLGDYADFFSVSSHERDPRLPQLLSDEVVDVMAGLQELDDVFPSAKKVFIEGNHEYRLERYLRDRAPALFGVTSTEHLLEINKRPNWKFVSYGPNQIVQVANSFLYARHEPIGPNAKTTATKAMCSIVHGHTHRIESAYSIGLKGDQHICYSPGWLGDKRKDMIYGYVKNHHQWTMGFSIVSVETDTGLFYPQIIQIIEDGKKVSCAVNGKVFKS
jgi:predicted MPP superfamily phosphohydrolase